MSAVTVPGKPQAKQRPRVGKGGRIYTPRETAQYEKLVADCWTEAGGELIPKGTAVEVVIHVHKDHVDVEVLAAEGLKPTARADLDNIAKSVLDGLNKVAWDDDRQVAKITVARCS
jgi:Holliday junction resolvase RusA-like endonuclease